MQAITTKFIPATNTRGSRIKATAAAGSITLHRDFSLSIEDNHAKAAKTLAWKMNWKGDWHMGGLPNEAGYCFVCTDDAPAFSTEYSFAAAAKA